MRKLVAGSVAVLVSMAGVNAGVIISDSFTAADAVLAGRLTPVGGVEWKQTAGQGTFRILSNTVVTQNNTELGKSPTAYLDYTGFTTSGQITTMKLDVAVSDAANMRIGFGTLASTFAADSSAFWADVAADGTVSFFKRSSSVTTQLGNSLDIKTAWNAVTSLELSYNHVSGTVSATAVSDRVGFTTHTLASTELGFTPLFNKFKIEVNNGGGTQAAYPYFDNLEVSVIPEPGTLGLFMISSAGLLLFRRMRR
jgi:hypothetical protein